MAIWVRETTLGKAYSAATGLQFVDLDWYIEERMHKSISDLFAERGEDGFRLLEQKMLHEAGEFENVLIACGGGTPCFFDNMDYMNHTGETVFLDVCPEVLFRRLKIAKAKRPLLANKTDEELMQVITSALEKDFLIILKPNGVSTQKNLKVMHRLTER